MPNLTQITPFLQMKDLEAAVRFFVDILGFKAHLHTRDFAYLQRESVALRLARQSPDCPEERFDYGPRAFLFYIDVADLQALLDEVRPRLLAANLPAGAGPVDQSWGQREWWVSGPEGGLIVFGQNISATPARP